MQAMTKHPKILGVAHGDPNSPVTYSGVPYHLFAQLRQMGHLVGVADGFIRKDYIDAFCGLLDVRRSLREFRPKHNAIWRFCNYGMKTLTKRFQEIERTMPAHNVVLQFGVGALPIDGVKLVAHVEISVATAINTEIFARAYGFDGHNKRKIKEAIAGERYFLDRCSLVITNSEWTAEGLRQQGVNDGRLRIRTPAAGTEDPGVVERRWDECNILFVGIDWERKGGPLLLKAFDRVRRANPKAVLWIAGCKPSVRMKGVRVYGYLRKDVPRERELLNSLYSNATIFCMPTYWDSTGIVYMEAALWGLPVVMLKGQGREGIFPKSMAIHVERATASALAETLIELGKRPEVMAGMGKCGRQIVLENYTWPVVAAKIVEDIKEITC